jgi:uncharacterized protein YqeY
MKERLICDLKEAMKNKDVIAKNTIQSIRASILQYEKDNHTEATNKQIEDILVKERKKRVDALEQFQKANREDLIHQTEMEIQIIEGYLPEQMSEEEIRERLSETISQMNADKSMFGQIMKMAKEEFGNTADGKTLSTILKELLN